MKVTYIAIIFSTILLSFWGCEKKEKHSVSTPPNTAQSPDSENSPNEQLISEEKESGKKRNYSNELLSSLGLPPKTVLLIGLAGRFEKQANMRWALLEDGSILHSSNAAMKTKDLGKPFPFFIPFDKKPIINLTQADIATILEELQAEGFYSLDDKEIQARQNVKDGEHTYICVVQNSDTTLKIFAPGSPVVETYKSPLFSLIEKKCHQARNPENFNALDQCKDKSIEELDSSHSSGFLPRFRKLFKNTSQFETVTSLLAATAATFTHFEEESLLIMYGESRNESFPVYSKIWIDLDKNVIYFCYYDYSDSTFIYGTEDESYSNSEYWDSVKEHQKHELEIDTSLAEKKQQIEIYEKLIKRTNQWNSAVSSQKPVELADLYAKQVSMYGANLTDVKCITTKMKYWTKHPRFNQVLKNDIRIKQENENIYTVLFKKQYYNDSLGRAKEIAAYLTYKRFDTEWKIIEEGDLQSTISIAKREKQTLDQEFYCFYDVQYYAHKMEHNNWHERHFKKSFTFTHYKAENIVQGIINVYSKDMRQWRYYKLNGSVDSKGVITATYQLYDEIEEKYVSEQREALSVIVTSRGLFILEATAEFSQGEILPFSVCD